MYGLVRSLPRLVQESLAAYGALQRFLVVGEMNGDIVRLERRRVFEGASTLVTLELSVNIIADDSDMGKQSDLYRVVHHHQSPRCTLR